jgi:hypothetical protein
VLSPVLLFVLLSGQPDLSLDTSAVFQNPPASPLFEDLRLHAPQSARPVSVWISFERRFATDLGTRASFTFLLGLELGLPEWLGRPAPRRHALGQEERRRRRGCARLRVHEAGDAVEHWALEARLRALGCTMESS